MGLSFRRFRSVAGPSVLFGLCAACTEVRIYDADSVSIHHSIGLAKIEVSGTKRPAYVTTAGVGAVLGQNAVVLGWKKEEMVIFPDARHCSVLIVLPDGISIKKVEDDLKSDGQDLDSICFSGRSGR